MGKRLDYMEDERSEKSITGACLLKLLRDGAALAMPAAAHNVHISRSHSHPPQVGCFPIPTCLAEPSKVAKDAVAGQGKQTSCRMLLQPSPQKTPSTQELDTRIECQASGSGAHW